MSELKKAPVGNLRVQIRQFEDRKISANDLARAVFHMAREINDGRESALRQALVRHHNRLLVLNERALGDDVHSEMIQVVDDIINELVDWGY